MMLPNGWKKSKIGETCSLLSGQDFPPNLYGNEEKGLPYITGASNFAGNHIILNRWTEHPKNIAKKGDILLVCKGSGFGITAIADFEKAHIARQVMALQKLNGVDRDFLYQVISMNVRNIKQKGCGLIPGIDRKTVLNIEYFLPPIEEQKKIATTLSVWDSAIEKIEKLIEAKIVQKKSLTCKLIENHNEVKFKLGNVTIDKSKWEKKKFKDVFEFLPTNTCSRELMSTDEGSIKNIHYGDVLVKYAELLDVNSARIPCLKSSVDSSKMTFLQSGDIVIADTAEDETVGKAVEILNIEDHLVVSGLHTMLCRPQKEIFYHGWLGYYINSKEFHRQLIPLITGIKVSSIAKKDIVDTIVLIPSFHEQKIIVETLSETNKELSLLKQQLENYKKQKQGLMQKLLTGQWRVK